MTASEFFKKTLGMSKSLRLPDFHDRSQKTEEKNTRRRLRRRLRRRKKIIKPLEINIVSVSGLSFNPESFFDRLDAFVHVEVKGDSDVSGRTATKTNVLNESWNEKVYLNNYIAGRA